MLNRAIFETLISQPSTSWTCFYNALDSEEKIVNKFAPKKTPVTHSLQSIRFPNTRAFAGMLDPPFGQNQRYIFIIIFPRPDWPVSKSGGD